MNRDDFEKLVESLTKESAEIRKSKSHDYADIDVLSNFKRVSALAKLLRIDFSRSYEEALFMLVLKLDRIQNLLKSDKVPNNESVKDSIQDAFNYLMLMYACLEDN